MILFSALAKAQGALEKRYPRSEIAGTAAPYESNLYRHGNRYFHRSGLSGELIFPLTLQYQLECKYWRIPVTNKRRDHR